MEKSGKIIGVGFQKTGTSSLREALKILGSRVKDTCPRALIPILKGDYGKILRIIRDYDAVEDTPWFMIYKELDQRLPGSKFILTIRDEDSWYKSVSRHIGRLRSAQHEWIYGRGKGLPLDDRENAVRVYKKHNEAVAEYFKNRPGDLLVMDFTKGDGWEKLCDFLGKDLPDQPFPHYNRGDEMMAGAPNIASRVKFFRKQVKNHVKIKYLDLRGFW